MNDCVLFQFGANLAQYTGKFNIKKHKNWPDLYKACNIKNQCESTGPLNHHLTFAQQSDENEEEESVINVDENSLLNNDSTTSTESEESKNISYESDITSEDKNAASILTDPNNILNKKSIEIGSFYIFFN